MLLLSVCLFSALSHAFAFSFAPIITLGLGGVLFRPPGIKITSSLGDSDVLMQAADFFTDAFWASKLASSQKQMQPRQRTLFLNSQIAEFRRRYGSPARYGPDRKAELLLAKRRNGDIVGCCGIELDKIPSGPKSQTTARGSTTTTGSSSSSSSTIAPLMSNLAVGKKYRRLGVARDMVDAAETLVRKTWGMDEVYLYVEQRNVPAVRLYQTLGYRTVWTDAAATTLVPAAAEDGRNGGGMAQVPTTLLCMRKSLTKRGGIFGRFFPTLE